MGHHVMKAGQLTLFDRELKHHLSSSPPALLPISFHSIPFLLTLPPPHLTPHLFQYKVTHLPRTMSTLEDLDDLEREERDKKKDQGDGDGRKPDGGDGDADMGDAEKKDEGDELLDDEILNSSTADIVKRRRMLENELRIMKSEFQRLSHEQSTMREKVKDNQEKIENNRYVGLIPSHPICP